MCRLVLGALVGCGAGTAARSTPGEPSADEPAPQQSAERARYLELARALAPEIAAAAEQCFAEETAECVAQERDGHVVFLRSGWGNGIDGGWDTTVNVYRAGEHELVLRYGMGGDKGAYVSRVRFEMHRGDREQLLSIAEQTELARDSSHIRWGLAQLFVQTAHAPRRRTGADFEVVGPLYEAGTFDAGLLECDVADSEFVPPTFVRQRRPMAGFMLFETRESLGSDEWVRVSGLRCSFQDIEVGPHRLRTYPLVGRNSGRVVAIHRGGSGADWRGQWVLETRNAVLGTTIDWLGAHRGWIFGRTRARHRGGEYVNAASLFAIRADDGVAVRFDLPPAYVGRYRGEELYFASMNRDAMVDDCVSARLQNVEEETQSLVAAAQGECDASIPQVDAVELTSTALRIQQTATQWTTIPLNSLMQVLNEV